MKNKRRISKADLLTFTEILDDSNDNYPGEIPEDIWDSCPFRDEEEFLALTLIQQKFIIGYGFKDLRGWSWAACYDFASPTAITNYGGRVSAARMAQHEKIEPFLKRWDRIFVERFARNADRIWLEEQSLAFSDILDYMDDDGVITHEHLKNLPKTLTRAIKEIEIIKTEDTDREGNIIGYDTKYKLKLWDKSAALGRMEKMQGMNSPEEINIKGALATIKGDIDESEAAQLYADLIKGRGSDEGN